MTTGPDDPTTPPGELPEGTPMTTLTTTRTPAAVAATAAESVRELNHATMRADAWEWPADVSDTLGMLRALVERLPQTLGQAARWLDRAHTAGRVGHDRGDALTDRTVRDLLASLNIASQYAGDLAAVLDLAHQHAAHLTGIEGDATR